MRWDKLWCPKSKIRMSLAWYINHSKTPNLRTRFTKAGNWRFWAQRAIKAGEELTIDYFASRLHGRVIPAHSATASPRPGAYSEIRSLNSAQRDGRTWRKRWENITIK